MGGRRRARADGAVGVVRGGRADDELFLLEQRDRAGVGAEELAGLLSHLLQYRVGVEFGREQPAGPGELLGQGARGALRFEEVAPLERASGGVRQMPRELDVVVRELASLLAEDERETRTSRPRRLDRHRKQRDDPGRSGVLAPAWIETIVVGEVGSRD